MKSKERIFNNKDVDLFKASKTFIRSFSIGGLVAKIYWYQNSKNSDFSKRHCANFFGHGEAVKHLMPSKGIRLGSR